MKILSIDLAAKTGWAVMEKKLNKESGCYENKLLRYGKFRTKGKTEQERVLHLKSNITRMLNEAYTNYEGIEAVVFEESFPTTKGSFKTLRAIFGKRYLLLSSLDKDAPVVSMVPNEWIKVLPVEFRNSKIDFKKDGTPKKAKGKEKKQLTLDFVNKEFKTNFEWHNEGVNCDNDITDAIAMGMAFLTEVGNQERLN